MPDPTVAQGHYDLILSNLSVSYAQQQDRFVAEQIFPVVPVNFASSFYFEFPRGYFFRDEVGPRPMGGYPRRIGYNLTKKSYLADEEALEAMLDDRERANYTPPNDPEEAKVRLLTSQFLIHKDRRWASSYFATGVWTTDVTGVASGATGNQINQWNGANTTPVEDILAWKDTIGQSTGFDPNVLVLGRKTYRVLRAHPEIRDMIKYTQRGGPVNTDLLAALFEVDRVVVPGGVINTANEGETDAFSFIFGQNHALLVYAAPDPGLDTPSGGYIFAWSGLLQDAAFNLASAVWRGREDRAHSDWFHVRQAYDMRVTGADLGVFFNGAVA